jgi:transcriptional regulator with GAF, ATPase, and Fis domain
MENGETDAFAVGDLFLQHFLPGDSASAAQLRGLVYRLNVSHKNKRMVPSILLLGEPGVGKGFVARVIAAHLWWLRNSKGQDIAPRSEQDVYTIADQAGLRIQTLTALPETLAESILFGAKRGAFTDLKSDRTGLFESTLPLGSRTPDPFDIFLDEIGDAHPEIQGKLLEVLETGTFRPLGLDFKETSKRTDARIIAATNRNLDALVEAGEFRADLYDRLNWARIFLPALRHQSDQIPSIIRRINARTVTRYNLTDAAPAEIDISWAQTYSWPGNHRELSQVMWEWHLFEGTVSLREIVAKRAAQRSRRKDHGEALIIERLFRTFDDIRANKRPGFKTFGDVSEEMRRIGYAALYRYNQQRQLKDEDLKMLFSEQDPTNVRKQISQNRPRTEEE